MSTVAEAIGFARDVRATLRDQITRELPDIRCRVRVDGATVAVVVLDHDNELWPSVADGTRRCQVRELIERTMPNLPVGFVSVSYERYAE